MEIPTLPPPLTTTTTAVKTSDPESTKQLSLPFTNDKRHKPLHHHQPPPMVVAYKECLKNHAAVMGGHAVDGCGEFMPSPSSSPTYPTSLKCAACGCHRNFHRREPEESLFSPPVQLPIEYQPHHRHHPPAPPLTTGDISPGNSPSPPPISSSYYPSAPPMLLPAENNHNPTTGVGSGSYPNGKKRFRTKFTQDQKGKMHEIAERIGWKIQKQDEEMIHGFCNEIGVGKNVFKVWMHNNKTTNVGNNNNNSNGNDNNNNHTSQVNRGIDFMISRNNEQHDLQLNNNRFITCGNLVPSST